MNGFLFGFLFILNAKRLEYDCFVKYKLGQIGANKKNYKISIPTVAKKGELNQTIRFPKNLWDENPIPKKFRCVFTLKKKLTYMNDLMVNLVKSPCMMSIHTNTDFVECIWKILCIQLFGNNRFWWWRLWYKTATCTVRVPPLANCVVFHFHFYIMRQICLPR